MSQTVAIVGASVDPAKYGNKAVRAYRDAGWTVYPVNPRRAQIEGLASYPDLDSIPAAMLDRVSFYVTPAVGLGLLDQVAKKQVGELWLNPGADSPEVVARAAALGLNVIQACAILGVGRDPGLY